MKFARTHRLRLVIKGGGHSYLGGSNATDSLLVWTRPMDAITLHDSFIAQGCAGRQPGVPAVSVQTGARWMPVYNAVTTAAGRYVQGGGNGSFGAVTRLTLRTRELPQFCGGVFGTIQARSDAAFRRLIAAFTEFYTTLKWMCHTGN